MQKFLKTLAWPYTAMVNYINTNPSAATIQAHVAHLNPVFVSNDEGVMASLGVAGTNVVKSAEGVDSALKTVEFGERQAFIAGVTTGVQLMQHSVANLTRAEARADNKALREVAKLARDITNVEQEMEQVQATTA
jgi:hypothetical protein